MRHALWVATACFIGVVVLSAAQDRPSSIVDRPSSSVDRPASSVDRPASSVDRPASSADRLSPTADGRSPIADGRSVVQKYCVSCHNEKVKSGGLTLSTLDLAGAPEHAEVWEQVIRKVRTGAMPPAGRPRPDKTLSDNLVEYLETELDKSAFARPNPGRAALPRLNRAEYRNAIRDVLALDIDAVSLLPNDIAGHGFDNNADALTLSPMLTERYLGAAAKISQLALARPKGVPLPETFFVPTDRNQNVRMSDDLPLGSRGGVALRYYFPADGEYLFELRPKEGGAGGGFEGITAEPHQLDIAIDNVKVGSVTLGGPDFAPRRDGGAAAPAYPREDRDKKIIALMTFRVPVTAGSHMVQAYFASKTTAFVEDLFDPSLRREPYRDGSGEPRISSVTITGPQPATATVGDTASRRRILTCTSASPKDETCAKKIISTLARRAYRRPVTDEDLQAPLTAYRGAVEQRRVRGGPRDGDSQHPDESEVPVPHRVAAPDGEGRHAVSRHRLGFGVAPVLLSLEQHS